MSKKLFIAFVNLAVVFMLVACGLLDAALTSGWNKVVGNDPTCSGLVCP
jgi:hypothetical protein